MGIDSAVRKRRCAEPYGSVYRNHFSSMVSLYHQYHDALKVILVGTETVAYASKLNSICLSFNKGLQC